MSQLRERPDPPRVEPAGMAWTPRRLGSLLVGLLGANVLAGLGALFLTTVVWSPDDGPGTLTLLLDLQPLLIALVLLDLRRDARRPAAPRGRSAEGSFVGLLLKVGAGLGVSLGLLALVLVLGLIVVLMLHPIHT